MNEFGDGAGDEEETGIQQLAQHRWKGAQSIGLAQQLNEQFIDLFCDLSHDAPAGIAFPLVAATQFLWRGLDQTARKRLAYFPFVIVDLRFGDLQWWRAAAGNGVNGRVRPAGEPPTRYEDLALETLMFAWQVAREDRSVAMMIFAMPLPVADCIAELTMQQVRMFAAQSAKCLRIRWDQDQNFWRKLLMAVRDPDEAALAGLRREAKLHFCGELVHPCLPVAP